MATSCPNCGKQIMEAAHFCIHCGQKLSSLAIPHSRSSDIRPSTPLSELDSETNNQPVKKSSYLVQSIILGLVLAILAALPRLSDLNGAIQGAAQGLVPLSVLRSEENDLIVHFITNWIIWTVVANLVFRLIKR